MKTWHAGMSDKETAEVAYYERNMVALRFADGWYFDTDNNWEGWRRVLSLLGGKMCFHIPDDFDVGTLLQIPANWDGHTTAEKWATVQDYRGVKRP